MSVTTTAAGPAAHTSNIPLAAAGLALGMLLSVLDQTIVSIALPDIAGDLGDVGSLRWIVTCYVLASTATGALYGRLSDRFGRRPVFLTAVGIFTIASALCGMTGTLTELVVLRTVQGIGAGALFTIPTIALAELFPVALRGRVQGAVGAIFAFAAVGGPLVGGAITDTVGWRWIFYINVPLGLISMALVGAALRLPRGGLAGRLDVGGSVLLVGAVVGVLLIGEWSSGAQHAGVGLIFGLGAAVVIMLGAFVWRERRTEDPVIPLGLFTNRVTGVILPATLVLGVLMYSSIVYLPTYLRSAFDMSATEAGLALNPYVVAFMVASFLSGSLASKTGRYRPFLIGGAVVIAFGFVLLGRLDAESSYLVVALGLIVLGCGIGMLVQLLVTVAQNAVAATELGAVTAAALALRGLGMSLGIAIYGGVLGHELAGKPVSATATADAIPDTLIWALPLTMVLLVLTLVIPDPAQQSRSTGEDRADPGRPAP
ncbi:MDR family MFS transporter [Nocardia sp. NBC_01009]|uniref:MDR family MFS transporter n=1 Tax=Nocardia sp. NBC_01009 TaxID=2975996 RepID=UPI00386D655E|nr:MFS transporter [Nocardia sp. NBC_01009]